MVDIFTMTLKVISRPFNIELLRLLLLDMVPLMQIHVLIKTDLCICRLQKSLIEFFSVILRPFQGDLS